MHHHTGSFTGVSNTRIFTQHWLPDAKPHAIVLIAHGLGEHSDRYAHVAATLIEHGYGVYALDHRGHGRSDGDRVLVSDFTDYFVADLRTYGNEIRAIHPDTPLFLYGHSMGSLIALLFTLRYQDELAGLITTGTALKLAGTNPIAVSLMQTTSNILPNARLIGVDANGISRDRAVVKAYIDDPLVYHGRIPLVTLAALQEAADLCIQHLPDLRLPFLAMHGSEDPLTLVKGAHIVLEHSGSPDTIVKIYEGLYHEIVNEPEQEQVFEDMLNWLGEHITPA